MRRRVKANAAMLFRFSAPTFNAHRIHNDREYARTEGYAGLVVQGPYLATLLMDHHLRRARRHLLDGAPLDLCHTGNGEGARFWVSDADGRIAMTAEVTA